MLTDKTFLVSIAQEGNNYDVGLYILLAAGVLMFIVAFLGCCGALKHSRCSLIAFFVIMLVVIVAQIAFAVWLYAHSDRLDELLRSSVISTVKVIFRPVIIRFIINRILGTYINRCCIIFVARIWHGRMSYANHGRDSIRSWMLRSHWTCGLGR